MITIRYLAGTLSVRRYSSHWLPGSGHNINNHNFNYCSTLSWLLSLMITVVWTSAPSNITVRIVIVPGHGRSIPGAGVSDFGRTE